MAFVGVLANVAAIRRLVGQTRGEVARALAKLST